MNTIDEYRFNLDPTGRKKIHAGKFVSVWIGALTGSPGVPPNNPQCVRCLLDFWDRLGRAYVVRAQEITGQFVANTAIIEEGGVR